MKENAIKSADGIKFLYFLYINFLFILHFRFFKLSLFGQYRLKICTASFLPTYLIVYALSNHYYHAENVFLTLKLA